MNKRWIISKTNGPTSTQSPKALQNKAWTDVRKRFFGCYQAFHYRRNEENHPLAFCCCCLVFLMDDGNRCVKDNLRMFDKFHSNFPSLASGFFVFISVKCWPFKTAIYKHIRSLYLEQEINFFGTLIYQQKLKISGILEYSKWFIYLE